MKKFIALFLISAGTTLAQSAPARATPPAAAPVSANPRTTPKSAPAPANADEMKALSSKEQLDIAREQIAEMQAEMEGMRAQLAADEVQQRAVQARVRYEAAVEKQRVAHHAAPGCDIRTDQTFVCPPAAPAEKAK